MILSAGAWGAVAGFAGWLLTWPLRRRSVRSLVVSIVVVGTAASCGALLGAAHAMLLPTGHSLTLVLLSLASGAGACAAALLAARRISREHRAIAAGIARLAPDVDPTDSHATRTLTEQLRVTTEALDQARQNERKLESSRRELIAWISHDLRTPLAGLRAMSEALEDDLVPEPHHYYRQMISAVDRLTGMVDDLFHLSQVQSAVNPAQPAWIDLDHLVSECIAGLEPLATEEGVRLDVRSVGSCPVRGGNDELHRAVTNVVANAIRHTPPGGLVQVEVNATSTGTAEILVQDRCGGIPDEVLPRVFEVGYRGDPARGRSDGGAGLGLAIARGIVEAHHGTVSVRNTEGGCCFSLRLPAIA